MLKEISDQFEDLSDIKPLDVTGGQKEIYTATLAGVDVVLKIVKIVQNDQARTEREIEAVTKLNSNYVPKIYNYGICNLVGSNRCFIVEQFIEGKTLKNVLSASCPLSVDFTKSIARQMLTACVDFESASLVHRDIKPDNIIVGNDEKVWIIDFGLARHLDLPSLTPDGQGTFMGMGTPGYAAPEQFRNIKTEINIRADLYSVGIVMYECLTGNNPYLAAPNPFEVIIKSQKEDLPRIPVSGGISDELSSFVSTLIQRFPSRRPQSGAEALEWFNQIVT